jgi:hypothetical protein
MTDWSWKPIIFANFNRWLSLRSTHPARFLHHRADDHDAARPISSAGPTALFQFLDLSHQILPLEVLPLELLPLEVLPLARKLAK